MTRFVYIRHGESNSTVERFVGGYRSCTGLSPLGIRQAEALRDRLGSTGELSAQVLISSQFERARQTAAIIAPTLGLKVVEDPHFGEHDPGPDCDGMSFDHYVADHGQVDWEVNPYLRGFPGGETLADFQHRVAGAIHRTLDDHDGATIVVVCHAGVVDVAMRVALAAAMVGGFELHTLNTSITEVDHTDRGRWRLVRYNDAAHLHGLPAQTPT